MEEAQDELSDVRDQVACLEHSYKLISVEATNSKAAAEKALSVEVEFADGRLVLGGKGPKKAKAEEKKEKKTPAKKAEKKE